MAMMTRWGRPTTQRPPARYTPPTRPPRPPKPPIPRAGPPLTASRLLLGAMRATQRRRGVLLLHDPRVAGFTVAHMIGFGPADSARVQTVVGVLHHAIASCRLQVRSGDATRPGRVSTGLGAVAAFPMIADGRVVGAFAVEDPDEHMPPGGSVLLRIVNAIKSADRWYTQGSARHTCSNQHLPESA